MRIKRTAEYWRKKWQRRATRFRAAGKNSRGEAFKKRVKPFKIEASGATWKRIYDRLYRREQAGDLPQVELAWREARAAMGKIEVETLTESGRYEEMR